jgi:aminopeptidase N
MAKRLLDAFQPAHYDLYLDIDRAQKAISGKTTIRGHASQAAIAVNQKYLSVASVQADGQDVPYTTDDQAETINITLPAAGDVTLTIDYSAPLTDTMMGIYPSYY